MLDVSDEPLDFNQDAGFILCSAHTYKAGAEEEDYDARASIVRIKSYGWESGVRCG